MTNTMHITKEEQAVKELFSKYAQENYFKINKDGWIIEELHFDSPEISELENLVNKPSKEFKKEEDVFEYLSDIFTDKEVQSQEFHINEFISNYREHLEKINEKYTEHHEILELIVNEIIPFSFKINNDWLKNIKIETVIILEPFQNRDQEYACNNFFNMFYSLDETDIESLYELKEMLDESSIKPLLEKQNLCIDNLITYMMSCQLEVDHILDDDITLKSVLEEIVNTQNNNALMVLRKLPFNEYLNLLEKQNNKDQILIKRNDTIGYFDPIHGSGSLFEIKLKNDMYYEADEYIIQRHKNMTGYSIADCYGEFFE